MKSGGMSTAKRAVPDVRVDDDVSDDDTTTKGSSIPPSDLSDEDTGDFVACVYTSY